MTQVRINLWPCPRNVSTALMYSFAQRKDTRVVDEPLYAHYLLKTGIQHPMRSEILEAQDTDPENVIDEVIFGKYPEEVLFIKNMCHHSFLIPLEWISEVKNLFLIRDPKEMITSYIKSFPDPCLRDLGYALQYELLERANKMNASSLIVEGDDLRNDPETVLRRICAFAGISFEAEMLRWPAGPIDADGVWAPFWYDTVHTSTGFTPATPKHEEIPERLLPLWEECEEYYQKMKRLTVKF